MSDDANLVYKCVPREPDDAMRSAMYDTEREPDDAWRAGFDAAPACECEAERLLRGMVDAHDGDLDPLLFVDALNAARVYLSRISHE